MTTKKTVVALTVSALALIGCGGGENTKTEIEMSLYKAYSDVFEINMTKFSNDSENIVIRAGAKEIVLLKSHEQGKYDFICMPIATVNKNVTLDCSGHIPDGAEQKYITNTLNISKDVLYDVAIGKKKYFTLKYQDSNITILNFKE